MRAVRSPIGTKEVLGVACSTELHAPTLSQHDPLWRRLRFDRVPGVDLRDHFRGALIGGGIGDAMAGRTQARGRVSFPPGTILSIMNRWPKSFMFVRSSISFRRWN